MIVLADCGRCFFKGRTFHEDPQCSTHAARIACHSCGVVLPHALIDAKDDGSGDFTVLQCEECYGPGFSRLDA